MDLRGRTNLHCAIAPFHRLALSAEAVKTRSTSEILLNIGEFAGREGGKALRAPAQMQTTETHPERGRAKPCPLPTCDFLSLEWYPRSISMFSQLLPLVGFLNSKSISL